MNFLLFISRIILIDLLFLNKFTLSTSDDVEFHYCDREKDLLCGTGGEEPRKENIYAKEKQVKKYDDLLKKVKEAAENYKPCEETTCACYNETIINNLHQYSNGISANMIENMRDRGTKYQIISHQLYRDKDCMFPSRCSGIEYFLLEIIDRLPDMELIINTRDYPQVSKYSPKSKSGPVFSFSKISNDYLDIMYPAWSFREGGPAISLYPTGLGRWDKHRFTITKMAELHPWHKKDTRGFFRGSRTSSERDALILLSRHHPKFVNAKYTKNQAWKSKADTLGEEPAKEVSLEDHCKYRYLFNYRGVAASFRFKHLFLCKSLVFHVGDEWIEFFYSQLKPWYHYIPVKKSASEDELERLIRFAKDNDEEMKQIAENGFNFIWDHLKLSDVECYWENLLVSYAKLLNYQVKLDKSLILVTGKSKKT